MATTQTTEHLPASEIHQVHVEDSTTPAMSVSVVLEWENMAYAAEERPRQTLASLKTQADSLYAQADTPPAHRSQSVRLSAPLDVLLPYDSEKVSEADVLRNVIDLITESESFRARLLPVGGGSYCLQKNAGAAAATGELVIFLDSDVTPEPGWLAAFMQAFLDPKVHVAVGNTYVDISRGDAYSRAMALSWMFPLRETLGVVRPSTWFYANNAAFRKDVFCTHQFPHTRGLKHHAATLLVRQLEQEGITLWYVGGARGHHPAPNGPVHFFSRALAAGRARVFSNPAMSFSRVLRLIPSDVLEIAWYCKRIVREGSTVQLRSWQVPAAFGVTIAYFTARLVASFIAYLVPALMRERLDI